MSVYQFTVSSATLHNLAWLLAMLLIDYAAVIAAILVDLRSGTLRARREGRQRTSRGYRCSVDKASRYLITLIALTVVDAMIVSAALMLRSTMQWAIPVFPLFTTLGALALAMIEGKSVMENTQRRTDFTKAAASVNDLLNNKELRKLIASLRELLPDP